MKWLRRFLRKFDPEKYLEKAGRKIGKKLAKAAQSLFVRALEDVWDDIRQKPNPEDAVKELWRSIRRNRIDWAYELGRDLGLPSWAVNILVFFGDEF